MCFYSKNESLRVQNLFRYFMWMKYSGWWNELAHFKIKSVSGLLTMVRRKWSSGYGLMVGSKINSWNKHKAKLFVTSWFHFISLHKWLYCGGFHLHWQLQIYFKIEMDKKNWILFPQWNIIQLGAWTKLLLHIKMNRFYKYNNEQKKPGTKENILYECWSSSISWPGDWWH